VEVGIEVGEFIGQDVCVWDDVEGFFAELFLHFYDIGAEAVFSSEFGAHGEMIDLLVLVEIVVNMGFEALGRPEDVPVVAFRVHESVGL
jgi:hypothetical protein